MTDALHPSGPGGPDDPRNPDALDELVSAYVDGEATADEAARIEADPALRARAAELRMVAAAVSAPIELPPAEVRDRHIAAALAAATPAGTATNLAAARERRERHRRRLWVVSAAAAVLMVLAAVPLLASLGNDDADTETAAMQDEDAAEESADAPAGPTSPSTVAGGDDGEATGGAATDSGGSVRLPRVDLGAFSTQDDLVQAVAQSQARSVPEAETEDTVPLVADDVCPPPAEPFDSITGLYTATVAGDPVTVYVYQSNGAAGALVLDAACDLILRTEL